MTPVAISFDEAVDAVERALRDGLDPEAEPARAGVDLPNGQLLLMPSVGARYVGVKLVTVNTAPDATARVQGVYALFDARTLRPLATMDGGALTAVRTPAVSAVAARHLAVPDARRLVVFGAGPQAWGHVLALRAVRPIRSVTVVGRDAGRVADLVARCAAAGLDARPGTPGDVARADVVACCTTAREPLFDGALPPAHATILAIGSHEPTAREVDEVLVRRATVVVESRAAAAREAGDLLIAGALDTVAGNLADLVRGGVAVAPERPRLFKSSGMAWEDLAVAGRAYEAGTGRDTVRGAMKDV
jgi:ornithine cyclodeaminase